MCVHVCVCVCVYVCVHACVYVCMYVCMYVCTMYLCMYACMYVCKLFFMIRYCVLFKLFIHLIDSNRKHLFAYYTIALSLSLLIFTNGSSFWHLLRGEGGGIKFLLSHV